MSLENFSTHELEKEIAKRNKSDVPIALENPNFEKLIITCKEHITVMSGGSYCDNDDEHYIYETAMEAVYGSDIWLGVNKQMR